jgi:hypothetical protein
MGHEDAFPQPRLSGRCRFGQATFAGTHFSGREAPEAVIRRAHRTHSSRSSLAWVRAPLQSCEMPQGDQGECVEVRRAATC